MTGAHSYLPTFEQRACEVENAFLAAKDPDTLDAIWTRAATLLSDLAYHYRDPQSSLCAECWQLNKRLHHSRLDAWERVQ